MGCRLWQFVAGWSLSCLLPSSIIPHAIYRISALPATSHPHLPLPPTPLPAGNQLYAAHCGDSRAVMSRNGEALRLTEDHKPNLPRERKRVEVSCRHCCCPAPCAPGLHVVQLAPFCSSVAFGNL